MLTRNRPGLSRDQRRQLARDMARENARWPDRLTPIPKSVWPQAYREASEAPAEVWRSRDYLVQVYQEAAPVHVRLSICRTRLSGDRWADNIPWDDLQRLKAECGFEDWDAVEVYPPAGDVVNVANLRHLWILEDRLAFAWRRQQPKGR